MLAPLLLLALVGGLITLLGFAPWAFWWAGILGPALWFAAAQRSSPTGGFWIGLVFGLGLMVPGIFWVHHSLHVYGDIPFAIASLAALLLALCMALYYAFSGWLAARLAPIQHSRYSVHARLLALVGTFAVGEWLRSWLFTGFPWLVLGYTQLDAPLSGFAPLGSVFLVSLLTAASAALLVSLTRPGIRARLVALVVMASIWISGTLLRQVDWTQATGDPIDVALVQGNISQDMKWLASNRDATIALYRDATLAHLDADIIIWPESAIPDWLETMQITLFADLMPVLLETETALVTGINSNPLAGRYYNTIVSLGLQQDQYYKRQLVPFGEYFPLGWLWQDWLTGVAAMGTDFTAGKAARPLLQVQGKSTGVSVCYEVIFPQAVRQALPDAAYLINLSNDGWFGDTHGPLQHLDMARMRALETGRMLVRTTNTGVTAIIDKDGQIQARLPQFTPAVLRGHIQSYAGTTPYIVLGLWPFMLLIAMSLLSARLMTRVSQD